MTPKKQSAIPAEGSQRLDEHRDQLKELLKAALHGMLKTGMEATLQAAQGVADAALAGLPSGQLKPSLGTRVGKIELRVPHDGDWRFGRGSSSGTSAARRRWWRCWARCYGRVSTRKVKWITKELYGREFSSGTISRLVRAWMRRWGKLRGGVGRSSIRTWYWMRAASLSRRPGTVAEGRGGAEPSGGGERGGAAVGTGVELAQWESATAWREFLAGLRERGLRGVVLMVSDDHAMLQYAAQELAPEALSSAVMCSGCATRWTRVPRNAADHCLLGPG